MQAENFSDNADISMIDLFRLFYEKKWLILCNTLFCFSMAVAYLYRTAPVYEARTYISAPTEGDIAVLNKGRLWDHELLKPLTVLDVYAVFNNILFSESAKRSFFRKYYALYSGQELHNRQPIAQHYASFSRVFSIKAAPLSASEQHAKYMLSLTDQDPVRAATLLKQYIALVNERTLKVLINNIQRQNAIVAYNLQHEINMAREAAKAQRYDRIAQLKEAMAIAQSAGIKGALLNRSKLIDAASVPYAVGSKVLEAEIKSLLERQSDDSFIPGLRQLQGKLDFYQSLVLNPEDVAVSHLDGAVEVPISPVSPKKSFILVMSLLLGLMTGAFGVMLQIAWHKEKYGMV